MVETAACRICGRDIVLGGRGRRPVFCKRCKAKADGEIGRVLRVDCKECGKPFSTKTRTVRYCSDACRAGGRRRAGAESQRKRMADPKKHALRLASARACSAARMARERGGRSPRPASPAASAASPAGRGAGGPRRSAKAGKLNACALCGRNFAPHRRGHRSIHCKQCSAKADRELCMVTAVNCKECGREFSTSDRNARYCSKACKADGRRRVARESARRRRSDPEIHAVSAAHTRAWKAARNGGKKGSGNGRRSA